MSQANIADTPRVHRDPRRIQVLFGGHSVGDSRNAFIVRDAGGRPTWYFPRGDVEMLVLHPATERPGPVGMGTAVYFTIYRDASVVENAAWSFEAPSEPFTPIAGCIAFNPAHFDFEAEGHPPAEWAADPSAQSLSPPVMTFASAQDLAQAIRRAADAHHAHELHLGAADPDWPDWYADYIVADQAAPGAQLS